MLEGVKVSKKFGGLTALKEVCFKVNKGEIVGLIGPNGAGKTTLFNIITGIYKPDTGIILFKGKDITGWPPYRICKEGIARTFQITKPFLQMTTLENVMIGILANSTVSVSTARQEAIKYLSMVRLEDKKDHPVKLLTLQQRRLLELARALATSPDLLLIDEIMAGLNPSEVTKTIEVIRDIRKEGITIFWIEHVMHAIMNVANRIIVLDHGMKIAEGEPSEVARNEAVIKAYLGEETFA